MEWLIIYAATLGIFLIVDGAWIFLVANKQYKREAGDSLRPKPQLLPGGLFYLIYAAGITLFAVLPLSWHLHGVAATYKMAIEVGIWGFGLGIFAYSSFALTNQSILKDWKAKLVIIDLFWGGLMTAGVTLVGFAIRRLFQ